MPTAQAEKLYRQALAVNPEDVRGLSNLGVLLSIESRDEEAMVTLTKALQLQPDSSEILTNLASMHHVGVHV